MQYDLNLLPVFMALFEERNVTRAAERLGITQPALSNALKRLRETMRDPLFVRERYGMQPTQMAQDLAPVIGAALAAIDEAVRGQQDFDPSKADRLFLIAPNSLVEFVLMPAIVARLREIAPGIRLRLAPFGNDLTEAGVVSGTTAMVIGRITDPPDNLVVQHLMDDGLACVVRADHPLVEERLTKAVYEQLRHVERPAARAATRRPVPHARGAGTEARRGRVRHALPGRDRDDRGDGLLRDTASPDLPASGRRQETESGGAAGRSWNLPGRNGLARPLSQRSRASLAALADRGHGAGTGHRDAVTRGVRGDRERL
ncbi:DNA-binding transcriptional LysR family regulator [Rhizobium metallidurans]|uniref:DNA-binding transcriptional LysR family regulator n=1 Tax=Rhizobium metallidurans TaxID=1265931 RepID=A0A7W6CSQ8_9HYPH|nr:DNA-binding transcriptional LysR family regulator [Rhizobium metallidurans]